MIQIGRKQKRTKQGQARSHESETRATCDVAEASVAALLRKPETRAMNDVAEAIPIGSKRLVIPCQIRTQFMSKISRKSYLEN